jgi:transposase
LHERPKKGAPYPLEFREEAVRYWLSSGKRVGEVALELGVSDSSLQHWRDQMEGNKPASGAAIASSSAISDADALELAREVGRLRKELEAMTRQRDILKKAIGAAQWAPGSSEIPNRGSR